MNIDSQTPKMEWDWNNTINTIHEKNLKEFILSRKQFNLNFDSQIHIKSNENSISHSNW